MKTKEELLLADCYVQIAAFAAAATVVICCWASNNALFAYFIVGGVQFTSFLVQLVVGRFRLSAARKGYAAVLLGFGLLLIPPATFIGLYALVFLSPIVAIWYFMITKRELRAMQQSNTGPDLEDDCLDAV